MSEKVSRSFCKTDEGENCCYVLKQGPVIPQKEALKVEDEIMIGELDGILEKLPSLIRMLFTECSPKDRMMKFLPETIRI